LALDVSIRNLGCGCIYTESWLWMCLYGILAVDVSIRNLVDIIV